MTRIEEIQKEQEELYLILDKKEEEWFKNNIYDDQFFEKYKEYEKYTEPERIKLGHLNRELRMLMAYKLSELSDFGDVMTLSEFIDCVNSGGFIDYDGYGHYVINGQETDIEIIPSDVRYGAIRPEFDTIIWFNR